MNENGIVITFDTDWADDRILDDLLNLLATYNIRATFFCTNKSSCDFSNHEIGIHPNFKSLEFDRHVSELKDIFPDATGLRSHSLFFSERLRPVYFKYGIEYTSNYM